MDELVTRGISLLSKKKISRTDLVRFIDVLPNSSPFLLDSIYEPLEGRWLVRDICYSLFSQSSGFSSVFAFLFSAFSPAIFLIFILLIAFLLFSYLL